MIINREALNIKKENTIDYNTDLFEYTLELTRTMNDDICLFTEAVGNGEKKIFNFEGIINAILDALFSAIKKLFRKFLALLAQLASMGSSFEIELRAYKERIKAFTGNVRLDFPYYEYSNLGEDIPGHDIYQGIHDILEFYAAKYSTFINQGGSAVSAISKLESEINPAYEQNKFRNRLLGRKNDFETNCSDFARLVSEYFKSGNDIPRENIVIDGSRVYHAFYEPYVDSKKEINKIKKEQNNVEREIKQVKSTINKNYFDMSKIRQFAEADQSTLTQSIAAIQRKLCTSVDLMCQDLLLFYGQKLQAYKDFKAQCRKILVLTIKACIVER